jgi:3-deoxy-D-manno-octulosonic-acid transferase
LPTLADAPRPPGLALRLYLAASGLAGLRAWKHLERRRLRGKEHPDRWREKAADTMAPRPDGALIWLHAVGLGEVLALRGLIDALAEARPDLAFLVTSSARASGEVFEANRPPRSLHQYLPLDVPSFRRRFLDHWQPDLSVWAEQDLWPGLVHDCDRRGIPLAAVNARMGDRAFRSRHRVRWLYDDIYRRFAFIAAQDGATADHIRRLAPGVEVLVTGSLKAACAALADSPERTAIKQQLAGRLSWCAASTHPDDEAVALGAQARRFAEDRTSLLILAPRRPERGAEIAGAARTLGLEAALRSKAEVPGPGQAVWIADSFGEMGLWYRLSPVALIGGSFGPVEGHNPWEAVRLGTAVLHGPRTANFAADYAALAEAQACRLVTDAPSLAAALEAPDLVAMAARAAAVQARAAESVAAIRDRLLALMPG